MLFNSTHYLIFLLVVCAVYYVLKGRLKSIWLLLASYFFYMSWNPWYALFLVFITLNDFVCARVIQARPSSSVAWFFSVLSISANVSLLLFFKFIDVINDALLTLSQGDFSFGNLVIPLGISYHTFQSISYIIDVRKGRFDGKPDLLEFALFIVFFPQLIAGPIERASTMFPQLTNLRNPPLYSINAGLKRFAWGIFRKAVIADRIALLIDPVFENPGSCPSRLLLFVLFAFTLQIYFDFSGYVDMASGSALLFGIKLSPNFNHPLSFISLRKFWRNWHISLSSWLRDYVYIPIGGRSNHMFRNLMFTFVLSGLWHGTGWNFLVFGILHGALLCVEVLFQNSEFKQKFSAGSWTLLPRFLLFHSALAIGWLLFRNPDMQHVIHYSGFFFKNNFFGILPSGNSLEAFAGVGMALIILVSEDFFLKAALANSRFPFMRRAFSYVLMLLAIIFFGVFNQREFIYFQF